MNAGEERWGRWGLEEAEEDEEEEEEKIIAIQRLLCGKQSVFMMCLNSQLMGSGSARHDGGPLSLPG